MISRMKIILTKLGSKLKVRAWDILEFFIVACIFTSALLIRLTPIKWGYYLTEFDPYYQFYMTRWIVSRGWRGFIDWFKWNEPIKLFWHPYGRQVASTSLPGVAFAGSFLYLLIRGLGVEIPLLNICVILPAIMGAVACILVYLLGRELESREAGLMAGMLLAVNYAFISRTVAGFYDDEAVAIPAMLLSWITFVRGLKDGKKSLLWGALAGFFLGYMALTWGAFLYALNTVALFAILALVLKRFDLAIVRTYIAFFIVHSIMIALIPKWGLRYLTRAGFLVPWAIFVIALIYELIRWAFPEQIHRLEKILSLLVLASSVGIIIALFAGVISGISGRYLSVLNPALRAAIPLVASVGEHRISTWSSLFYEYQTTIVLALLGIYLAFRRRRREDLFIVTYGLTSLYAAASMARLSLLMAPAFTTLAGIGFSRMMKPIKSALRGELEITKRRKRILGTVGPLQGALAFMIIIIFAAIPLFSPYIAYISSSPALILTASLPLAGDYRYTYTDWISALEWMRNNLPEEAVIASWWDYGYWIAVLTNRSSTCDNATLNSTQIRLIAQAFLSNETIAIEIYRKLGVKYVVVFEPFQSIRMGPYGNLFIPDPRGYGDFGKSVWMARIAGLNVSKYITYGRLRVGREVYTIIAPANTTEATQATLYKLLFKKTAKHEIFLFEVPKTFLRNLGIIWEGPEVRIPEPVNFKLVFESEPNGYVLVYKVLYPEER